MKPRRPTSPIPALTFSDAGQLVDLPLPQPAGTRRLVFVAPH